jgi:hypothetical protein
VPAVRVLKNGPDGQRFSSPDSDCPLAPPVAPGGGLGRCADRRDRRRGRRLVAVHPPRRIAVRRGGGADRHCGLCAPDTAHPGRNRADRRTARHRSHRLRDQGGHHQPAAARLRPCHALDVMVRAGRAVDEPSALDFGAHRGGRPVGSGCGGGLALRRNPRAPPTCARGDPCLSGVDLARDCRAGRADARRDVRGEQPPRAVLRLVDRDVRGAMARPRGRSGHHRRRTVPDSRRLPSASKAAAHHPHPRGVSFLG